MRFVQQKFRIIYKAPYHFESPGQSPAVVHCADVSDACDEEHHVGQAGHAAVALKYNSKNSAGYNQMGIFSEWE